MKLLIIGLLVLSFTSCKIDRSEYNENKGDLDGVEKVASIRGLTIYKFCHEGKSYLAAYSGGLVLHGDCEAK